MEKGFYTSKYEQVKLIGIVQVQKVLNGKVYFNEFVEAEDIIREESLPVDEFMQYYGKIVGSTVYDPTDNADKAIESLADFLDAKLKYHRGDDSDGDDSASDSDDDDDNLKIQGARYLEEYSVKDDGKPKKVSSLFDKEYTDEEDEEDEEDDDDEDNNNKGIYNEIDLYLKKEKATRRTERRRQRRRQKRKEERESNRKVSSLFDDERGTDSSGWDDSAESYDSSDESSDEDNDDPNVYKSRYKKRKRKLKGGEVNELEMDVVNKLNF